MPAVPKAPYLAHARPLFFAHRGGAGLAPENTLVAFEQGLRLGADALELDVRVTRDGELVVLHDATLDRTTDGTGPLAAQALAEVVALDAGYRFTADGGRTFPYRGAGIRVPTLRAVIERFPTARVNIDLKVAGPGHARRLWALIEALHARERVLVGSFHSATLDAFRALAPNQVATAATPAEVRRFVLAAAARVGAVLRPRYDALQVPETWHGVRVISPLTVRLAHQHGVDVHVWTVDDRAQMARLLRWGVDGLMTDRPDLLADVLASYSAGAPGT